MLRNFPSPTVRRAAAIALLAIGAGASGASGAEPRRRCGTRAAALMAQYQCGRCHAIPGVAGARGRLAVPLDAFGARSYIAGRIPNGRAALARWIVDPPALVPGTLMPNLGVSADRGARHRGLPGRAALSSGAASVLTPAGPAARAGRRGVVGADRRRRADLRRRRWRLLARGDAGGADRLPRRSAIGRGCWIVGGGLVLPVAVLGALFVYQLVRGSRRRRGRRPPRRRSCVSVTGRMWWWEVRYRDPAGGPDIVLANEIHLPAGRAALIGLNSGDVIHSFWVPALAGKVDMVPGRVQQLRLDGERAGHATAASAPSSAASSTRGWRCTSSSTAGDEFERWLRAQAAPAAAPRGAAAERGRAVFEAQRCAACHAVRGLFDGGTRRPRPDARRQPRVPRRRHAAGRRGTASRAGSPTCSA